MTERTRAAFDWTAVDPTLTRRLVRARAEDLGEPLAAADLRNLNDVDLRLTAERNLGRLLRKDVARGRNVLDLLRGPWLRTQPSDRVEEVVTLLSVGLRRGAPASRAARLTWIQDLNRTTTLANAVRMAFLRAHYVDRPTRRRRSKVGEDLASSAITLRGREEKTVSLYPHQQKAHVALEAWIRRRPSGGVIVLPTGAGKTLTATTWLVEWLAGSPGRRVLWLAHQRELVDQAARAFDKAARGQPEHFERRLRVIHGAGSAGSTLSEPGLAVAAGTMQSLRPDGSRQRLEALRRFCDGSTIVVVDEAHRATSPTYAALLDVVQEQGGRVLGLTATPTPPGPGARARFASRFGREPLLSVDPDELVRLGVLARPVFHKVDTHISVELTAEEVRASIGADLPPQVLKRLARPARDHVLLKAWLDDREQWGRTLVFATSIDHAEALTGVFRGAGIDARAVHSQRRDDVPETLAWFRTSEGDPVLISVGMLTEGVDLPEAQTAFLARPTSSPVLMRQMVGRVLRGPKASGGTEVAHLVTLHDDWMGFTGIIEPVDLTGLAPAAAPDEPGQPAAGIRLVSAQGEAVPPSLLGQVQRLYADHAALVAQGASLSRASLVGYYALADTRVPVFDHQRDGYDALLKAVLAGESLQGRGARSFFDDDPLPHPTDSSLRDLVRETREGGERPDFIDCTVVAGAEVTAHRLRSSGALTPEQRDEIVREGWGASGFLSHRTFEHFVEAVDRRVRELARRASDAPGTVVDPEDIVEPVNARRVPRDLGPLFAEVVHAAPDLLHSAETRERLDVLPQVKWTQSPLKTMHAYWRPRRRGRPIIRVSIALSVAHKHVSDELLRYLLWHELLHHLLPGHGHDAEFRELESRWPEALDLDRELDTLHERIGMTARARSGG